MTPRERYDLLVKSTPVSQFPATMRWRQLASVVIKEVDRLRAAIATHRDQKADDRCIEDDDRLYEALGDGIKCDRRVGDKGQMYLNCMRFITNRCEGGGWPSYAELEAERNRLRAALAYTLLFREFSDEWHNSDTATVVEFRRLRDLALATEEPL